MYSKNFVGVMISWISSNRNEYLLTGLQYCVPKYPLCFVSYFFLSKNIINLRAVSSYALAVVQ